jgi:hypothetical protein
MINSIINIKLEQEINNLEKEINNFEINLIKLQEIIKFQNNIIYKLEKN